MKIEEERKKKLEEIRSTTNKNRLRKWLMLFVAHILLKVVENVLYPKDMNTLV